MWFALAAHATFQGMHCRLVLNKATGKAKGTAFADFATREGAKKAVAASAAHKSHAGPGVSLKGRQLEVDLALDQDAARQLAREQGKSGKGGDKRNLYLVRRALETLYTIHSCRTFSTVVLRHSPYCK